MPIVPDTVLVARTDSISDSDTLQQGYSVWETGRSLLEFFDGKTRLKYDGVPIDHSENIWQFSLLLGMFLLIALLTAGFGNRMNMFIKAVLAPRYLRQLMREESFLFHPFSLLLILNAGVVYALLGYKAIHFFTTAGSTYTGLLFFITILGIILLLLAGKLILLRLMEYLTDTDLGQRENRYTWIMFHQLAGLILFPVAGITLFGKEFWLLPGFIFALSVVIILLIFRVGKGLLLANGSKVYFLHLFLYLCTLEIIPLIVMIKVLMSQMYGFNE